MFATVEALYLLERLGIRGIKAHQLSRHRMLEIQMRSMKRQAADRICASTVILIADNRVAAFGQVHANLMFPARF